MSTFVISASDRLPWLRACLALLALALCCASACGADAKRFPGVIDLAVDATDVDKRIVRVREAIPVTSGRLTLLYPQWIPGNHGPTGAVALLAGLRISGNGKPIPWTRDAADMYAFHVDVPGGVDRIEAEFQYLSPLDREQGRVVMTQHVIALQWHTVVLYPAGYAGDDIPVRASIALCPRARSTRRRST